MTATEPTPTAEHIDAVANLVAHIRDQYPRLSDDADSEDVADAILTSTDPAVHAAMLDALVRAGVLTELFGVRSRSGLGVPFGPPDLADAREYATRDDDLEVVSYFCTPWREVAP